jgi:DNA-binding transcriptional ArsR family regulator
VTDHSTTLDQQIKAIDSDVRRRILGWLRDPSGNFPLQEHGQPREVGVCVMHIQQKAGLSPATISSHLGLLASAGLITTTSIGKWTYVRRDEDALTILAGALARELTRG